MVATKRHDGRAGNELRPLASEQGALFRADGSARMAHGGSAVLAAVYGPGQAKSRRSEQPARATLDVCFKLEKGVLSASPCVCVKHAHRNRKELGADGFYDMAASKEKEYEQVIRQTFEPVVVTENFPRAVISIVVQVVEDNGSISSPTEPLCRYAYLPVDVDVYGCDLLNCRAPLVSRHQCREPRAAGRRRAHDVSRDVRHVWSAAGRHTLPRPVPSRRGGASRQRATVGGVPIANAVDTAQLSTSLVTTACSSTSDGVLTSLTNGALSV